MATEIQTKQYICTHLNTSYCIEASNEIEAKILMQEKLKGASNFSIRLNTGRKITKR